MAAIEIGDIVYIKNAHTIRFSKSLVDQPLIVVDIVPNRSTVITMRYVNPLYNSKDFIRMSARTSVDNTSKDEYGHLFEIRSLFIESHESRLLPLI